MEITLRHAALGDAPAIAQINLASWEAAYRGIVADAFLDNASLEGRTTQWRERITAAANPILVAEVNGALQGYCSLVLPARDTDAGSLTAEIGAIYIAPDRFRGGIGSALIDAALDLMRERAFRDATLWVLTQNTRARAFYGRHGFHTDGTLQWIDGLEAEEIRLRRAL
jgi:ribosomal protein S18 acetylase RimI-like enzyme